MKILINCQYCGEEIFKEKGAITRAIKKGYGLFCDQTCSGLSRRLNRSDKQKKEKKRLYDIQYRLKNKELIQGKKKAYFKKIYTENPEKFKAIRRKRQQKHNEYCRQPKYVEYKKKYDRDRRCKIKYGKFWEAASILIDLNNELDKRETKRELELINKTLKRKKNNNY